jgi:hypothetical protein
MSENLATEFAMVGADLIAGPPDLVYVADIAVADSRITVPVFDSKVKASGGRLAMTYASAAWVPACPWMSPSYTFGGGAGFIWATCVKCRASGLVPLRENDSALCSGSWVPPGGGSPVLCSCTISITDAGQDKAKGE